MPAEWANWSIGKIAAVLIPDKPFLMTEYMPELLKVVATKSYLPLPLLTSLGLLRKLIGVLIKLIWAFIWQEEFVVVPFLTSHAITKKIGAAITPVVNGIASFIDGIP